MTVVVQSDEGDVEGANSYLSVADFKLYHDARGNSYVGKTDIQIGYALVRATDYVDTRFLFRGVKSDSNPDVMQTTQWPRKAGQTIDIPWWDVSFASPDSLLSVESFTVLLGPAGEIVGIPQALKNATAEYALRALAGNLFQDAPAPPGGRLIDAQTVKVGTIEQSITYAKSQATGNFVIPAYPIADLMIARAGLIESGRVLFR